MSTLDFRDLPEDRLSTSDKEGNRIWIIPARVRGRWKNRKTVFHIFLLAIFVLTPWLRYKGAPIVLFDILDRQFVILGKVFASYDAPLLFFVFGTLGFGLIIATVLWGRIWCGWACPQTVFLEQVFRRIETFTVGNRASQLAARKDPFKPTHLRRLFFKWVLFIGASLILAHTFMAYFISWEQLLAMMVRPPSESWTVFLIVVITTATVLFEFTWFREQFCIIMCPYVRFQSVLMDQDSVTISYDYNRGEPRARGLKKKSEEGAGDCIDCYKCVSVCPTGIDIRAGQQMECVGCTACIDACDEVMKKIDRPQGLIRYASLSELEKVGRKLWSPRLAGYLGILFLMLAGFIYSVSRHESFYVAILRQNQRPYVVSDAGLMNNFKMHLKNPTYKSIKYSIHLLSDFAHMAPETIEGSIEPNGNVHRPFFVRIRDWQQLSSPFLQIQVRYQRNDKWVEHMEKVKIVFPKGS